MSAFDRPECPCGTGEPYDACCGRLHRGAALAATPQELMRSRYAAFAVGGPEGADYLWRTWHPRTRPDVVDLDPDVVWTGLTVHDATDDEVEFTAARIRRGVAGAQHERSRFARRGGRWVYVEPTDSTTRS